MKVSESLQKDNTYRAEFKNRNECGSLSDLFRTGGKKERSAESKYSYFQYWSVIKRYTAYRWHKSRLD